MPEDYAQRYSLMLRARDLIAGAVEQHIYDNEEPDPDCRYMRWLRDCDQFLIVEESNAVPHL